MRLLYSITFLIAVSSCSWASPQPQRPAKRATPRAHSASPTSGAASPAKITDTVAEHYRAAETFQVAGDLKSAEAEYRRAISIALQRLAIIKIVTQGDQAALELLRAAVEADASDGDAQMSLAAVYFRTGDLSSAKTILEMLLAKNEHNAQAEDMIGKALFLSGDYQGAAARLEGAQKDGAGLESAYALGLADLKLRKVSEASLVFDEMLTKMENSPEPHVLFGRAYREGGQYDLATEEFKKALTLNPNATHAHSYLGMTYLLQRGSAGFGDAEREFRAELVHDPKDFSSHYYLGIIHLKRHEYAPAQQELSAAVNLQPNNAAAHLYAGEAQLQSGNTQAAIAQLQDALRLSGGDAKGSQQGHALLAQALAKSGKAEQAKREEEQARQGEASTVDGEADLPVANSSQEELRALLMPSLPASAEQKFPEAYVAGLRDALGNAYHNVGVIHAQQKQYAAASAFFAEASKWAPKIKSLDKNWGTAAFRANQYKVAVDPLSKYLRSNPEDGTTREMLALSYFMTEDYSKAAETFRPVLANLPENPSLLYAAGVSLAKSGDANGASKIFQRMLTHDQNAPEVHLFLGESYADLKRDNEALKEFSRALELNPKMPGANSGIGMVNLRSGSVEQAEKAFRAELAVNPGDPVAEYWLGHLLLTEQKQSEAIPLLSDVARQNPDNGDAHYDLGKALLEQGELQPATERLQTAIRLQPTHPNAYYQLSLAYRRQGRAQQAEAMLQQYEKLRRKKPVQ